MSTLRTSRSAATGVPHVFQHTVQEDCVERAFGKGQAVKVGYREQEVRCFPLSGLRARDPELVGFHVDANHLSRCDNGCKVKRKGPRAATAVQQGHAGSQVRHEKGGVTGGPAASEEFERGGIVADRVHVLLVCCFTFAGVHHFRHRLLEDQGPSSSTPRVRSCHRERTNKASHVTPCNITVETEGARDRL